MSSSVIEELQAKMSRRFRAQSLGCGFLGSDIYREILSRAADDIDDGGRVWAVIESYARDPGGSMLALRLLGATHRLALSGAAPDLAAHYPSTGGDGDPVAAWDAWHALVGSRGADIAPMAANVVQTNEVGRAAALLGGFLQVARVTDLPLRLLEVGASAGLNLRWDRFAYRAGDQSWGPPDSAVDLGDPFVGDLLPSLLPSAVEVIERRGCDLNPIDPTTPEGRLTLLSFVWPDQVRRFANLSGASEVAAELPVVVERASADSWLASLVERPAAGTATVVFHSVMLQYVAPPARSRLLAAIAAAGDVATRVAPLAWLRLEPLTVTDADMEVHLTLWPGGQDRLIAYAHPHGNWVRWQT